MTGAASAARGGASKPAKTMNGNGSQHIIKAAAGVGIGLTVTVLALFIGHLLAGEKHQDQETKDRNTVYLIHKELRQELADFRAEMLLAIKQTIQEEVPPAAVSKLLSDHEDRLRDLEKNGGN